MKHVQAVVIGGGSAGLSAAVTLKKKGIQDVLVLEKDNEPGGILQQCIHNGFGLHTFHEQLSGPAYAERFIDQANAAGVDIKTGTMVTHFDSDRTLEYVNAKEGYVKVSAEVVLFATGCYERSRGAIGIPGARCSGVYTAGQAQRYLNIDGYLVGKNVFILGSGDIGLIMARRMTLEGAKVHGVAELMPYSNGLPRNIKQCLEDFNIPLYLSHTVTNLYGKDRLNRLELSKVDENRRPIPGTEKYFDVDTLLLSVGLIPENHLLEEAGVALNPRSRGPITDENYMTSIPGVFSCGNGLHVHDLVDYVTLEASRAAEGAVRWMERKDPPQQTVSVIAGEGVGYVVPAILHPDELQTHVEFFFRVRNPMKKAEILARSGTKILRSVKKTGLMPSEMERFLIPVNVLKGLKEDVIFEVRETE